MSVAVAEALHRANQQLAQGQGPVVDFLGKGWQDTTVGDSEGLYVVDVVMPEEVAEGDSDVLLLEYELPLRVPRPKGSARPSRSASGSPYLTGMGSSVRQRSSSGEAVKPSSSSSSWMGEPPAEGGAARGRSDPNTERGKVQAVAHPYPTSNKIDSCPRQQAALRGVLTCPPTPLAARPHRTLQRER
mmetsp:Transcript_17040/g.43685  ORF Transcript_17040/g.43685 Transcript_17040/m.43685 type:complete len:187 (-) Transcript_17040:57-617(-)